MDICATNLFMSFQYTYNAHGKPIGVFVPLNEWEKITIALKEASGTRRKVQINNPQISRILKGLKQVDRIEKGKLKSISIKQLLNEL